MDSAGKGFHSRKGDLLDPPLLLDVFYYRGASMRDTKDVERT